MRDGVLKALYDWNPWFEGEFPQELSGIPRDYQLDSYLEIPEIKILEGARRVGKSTLLYQVIEKLVKQKRDGVLYINFEDEVLKRYSLSEVVESFPSTVKYLFIDEIQNCREWISFIRKAHDRKQIPQIWISGSNSSFIQNEFATQLTGRNVTIQIYPLTFKEFLRFKGVEISFSTKREKEIKNLFLEYLTTGAFPAVVLRTVLQRQLLMNYFEDFVHKDIASRHEVNLAKIKELGIYLATNSSKTFSYRSAALALNLHSNTVMDYCSYYFEIFLFQELYKFDYSLKNQIGNDKKIYILDTGLAEAISFRFSEDRGRVFECMVHNALKQKGFELYFHKQKGECDFLIKEGLKITQAIQVCLSIEEEEVKAREVRGLTEAMEIYGLKRGLILTLDEEMQLDNIDVLPAWKFLL